MSIYEHLDSYQLAAVKAPNDISIVNAGAGTGKTTTLTARIAYLIDHVGLPPQSIMAVTFTNKAAAELKVRLKLLLGDRAAAVQIGTFHGLSHKILRRYPHLARLQNAQFSIADEQTARSLMHAAIRSSNIIRMPKVNGDLTEQEVAMVSDKHERFISDLAKDALAQVQLWKSWGLTDDEAGSTLRAPRSDVEEELASLYCAYQYELESKNLVDFGDLLFKVVALFQANKDVLEREAGAIRHMLVDEAQDADPVQVEWVRRLTSVHNGLTVVGDEDQNIYAFKGGYNGAMRHMAGEYAASFTLPNNRRCTQEILDPAIRIVNYNKRSVPKHLFTERHGSEVVVTGHTTEANEAQWVAEQIKIKLDAGQKPGEIAILVRLSKNALPFEGALYRLGIKASVYTGRPLMERAVIADLIALLKLALNPHDELSFVRVVPKLAKGVGAVGVDAIIKIAKDQDLPFHEASLKACEPRHGLGFSKSVSVGIQMMAKALHDLAAKGRWGEDPHSILTQCNRVLRDGGGYDPNAVELDGYVETLFQIAEGYVDPLEFINEMQIAADHGTAKSKERVQILTMHASKGMEFETVFCAGFDYGNMPLQRVVDAGVMGFVDDVWYGPHGGGVEEERRLAHVAFTRAKNDLYVTFPDKRKSQPGVSGKGGPSSFIEECMFDWAMIKPSKAAALGMTRITKRTRAERLGLFD